MAAGANANDIIVNLRFNYSEVSKAITKTKKAISTLDSNVITKQTKDVSKLTGAFNDLGFKGNSVAGIFGRVFAKISVFLGATTIFYGLVKGIGAVAAEMKHLQDETLNLRRVMQGNDEVLDANTKSTYLFAKEMNNLVAAGYTETIRATTEAVKAGFDFKESLDLARVALLASNVTELEAADATRYLVSTIRQFSLESKDSLSILDQWNTLGQETGATTQGIAEAVIRAGNAFSLVGGSLTQLNALASATIETTGQSGEKIGTMLNTVSARYADVTKQGSFYSEMLKIGIKIYDETTGEYKNMYKALYELSKVYGTLEEKQQSQIAKAAAGIRQYSRFAGMIKHFDRVMRNLLISIDSGNSSLTENQKRVKSYDFALKQLQGSISQLALDSTGFLQVGAGILNMLRSFLNILNPIIAAMSRVPSIFYVTGASILATRVAVGGLTAALGAMGITVGFATGGLSILLGLLATVPMYIQHTRDESERLGTSLTEQAIASLNSRDALAENADVMIDVYKNTKKGSDMAELIETTFNNVAGISLRSVIKETDDLQTSVKKIMDVLSDTSDYEYALDKMVEKSKLAFEEMSGWAKFWSPKDEQLNVNVKVFKNLKDSSTKDIAADVKLIEKYNEAYKKNIKLKNNDPYNQGSLFKEGDFAFQEIDKLMKTYELTGNETSDQLLAALQTVYSLRITLDDKALQKEINNNKTLLIDKTEEAKQYAEAMKKANLDALKAIQEYQKEVMNYNRNFISGIVDSVLALKEGNTVFDNIRDGMIAFGNNLYEITKKSITEGILEGMQMKKVYEELSINIQDTTSSIFKDLFSKGKSVDNTTEPGILSSLFEKGGLGLTVFQGLGLGGLSASMTGRDSGQGAMLGGIGSLIGNMILPGVGGIVGGLLGGLFGGGGEDTSSDPVDESLKYQRESTKELKEVNRNLILMRQDLKPWEYINDSYFFSQANNRAYVGA
ncbi:MAG: phage tail tape measure protein [Candidatus Pacebacteria bacterium]|nr:phage tail tape measure protein [Candidatus Paceibacterota bacterium]